MESDDRNATPNQTNPLEQTISSLNNPNEFFVNTCGFILIKYLVYFID